MFKENIKFPTYILYKILNVHSMVNNKIHLVYYLNICKTKL